MHIRRKVHTRTLTEVPIPTSTKRKATKSGSQSPVSIERKSSRSQNENGKVHRSEIESEAEMVLTELEQQAKLRKEIADQLKYLESQNSKILSENIRLKQMVAESTSKQAALQDRMERIFQVWYHTDTLI